MMSPDSFHTKRFQPFVDSIVTENLKNGMKLVHIPTPNRQDFSIDLSIGSGSSHETRATNGISHFLEHMMFKGSRKYPSFLDLAERLEVLGGEWNAATGREHTEYSLAGISLASEPLIGMFYEFLENPKFGDFDVEKLIILRELAGEYNDHGNNTDLDFHIHELFFCGNALSLPILGTEKTIGKMVLSALKDFRDAHYLPRCMGIVAVGGDGETTRLIADFFSDHRYDFKDKKPHIVSPPIVRKVPGVRLVEHSDNEYEVALAFVTEGEWSEKSISYEMISRILSDGFASILNAHLRESKGLVYSVDAELDLYENVGTLTITAAVKPEQLTIYFQELCGLLRDLRNDGPQEKDFQRAKIRSAIDLELSPDEPHEVANQVMWAELKSKPFDLIRLREKIVGITHQSVTDTCREVFTFENSACVILGPLGLYTEDKVRELLEKFLA
jgi:predicted Zn-dependent peptidase